MQKIEDLRAALEKAAELYPEIMKHIRLAGNHHCYKRQKEVVEKEANEPFDKEYFSRRIRAIEREFDLPGIERILVTRDMTDHNNIKREPVNFSFKALFRLLGEGNISERTEFIAGIVWGEIQFYDWLKGQTNEPPALTEKPATKEGQDNFAKWFINPERDIPFVLDALKRVGFIDENEQWRVSEYSNPRGVIVAMVHAKQEFFVDNNREGLTRAFVERFGVPPKPRFYEKGKPFETAKKKMAAFLKDNS